MIPSCKKISSVEFSKFYKKGLKRSSQFFLISLYKEKENTKNNFAVIISKKTFKTAVLRHKNKRRIYNIIRQLYPQFLEYNYIFITIKSDISEIKDSELKNELSYLILKK